jgi:hypothetical protein
VIVIDDSSLIAARSRSAERDRRTEDLQAGIGQAERHAVVQFLSPSTPVMPRLPVDGLHHLRVVAFALNRLLREHIIHLAQIAQARKLLI